MEQRKHISVPLQSNCAIVLSTINSSLGHTLWFASCLSPIFLKWIDGDEIVPLTNWIVEIGNTIRARSHSKQCVHATNKPLLLHLQHSLSINETTVQGSIQRKPPLHDQIVLKRARPLLPDTQLLPLIRNQHNHPSHRVQLVIPQLLHVLHCLLVHVEVSSCHLHSTPTCPD